MKFTLTKSLNKSCDEYSDSPDFVKLHFSAEECHRIFQVQCLLVDHKLHSAKIDTVDFTLINKKGKKETEWCYEAPALIVYPNYVRFYTHSKHDFNDLVESDDIYVLREVWPNLKPQKEVHPKQLKHVLFISKEDGGNTFEKDGFEAFLQEVKEGNYITSWQTYEIHGNDAELMKLTNSWDIYAYITEDQFNQLNNL